MPQPKKVAAHRPKSHDKKLSSTKTPAAAGDAGHDPESHHSPEEQALIGHEAEPDHSMPLKGKKALDLEVEEVLIPGVDKSDDPILAGDTAPTDEDGDEDSELSLDDEELDPFGDKWEA